MDCSPPGSSTHGILQARVLEWVAIAFSASTYEADAVIIFILKAEKNEALCLIEMEKAMVSHFSTLAWKILWMEEPGRLQSMGSRRVRHN